MNSHSEMPDTKNPPCAKVVDHLPVIAHAVNKLGIRALVDELVPVDPRNKVTTGECIQALITTVLLGKHTLYQVGQVLDPYDLQVAFGFREMAEPRHFNDERVGKALDDLFDVGGVAKVNAAAILAAIRAYDLSLASVHLDTTSVSVYGEYERSREPAEPDDPNAIPHIARGYSKDHRPDLKQIVYGLAVTGDGAVPVFGRVSSGNRADARELRFILQQTYEALPSPEETLFVADSKLFCGETVALLEGYELSYVTLLPKSFGLWQKAYESFRQEQDAVPVLKIKGELGDGPDERHRWRGRSYVRNYEFKWDDSDYSVPVRLVVVESDALKARKRPALERRRERERIALAKLQQKHAKRTFACKADATRALERLSKRAVSFHRLEVKVSSEERRKKRSKPGRPRKDEIEQTERVWRVEVSFSADQAAFERIFAADTCFVLVTNLRADAPLLPAQAREKLDRRILLAYDDQDHVERSFRWTKHPLEVAPIFLKSPKRIAALGLVYALALMVYALIQRDARARLASAKAEMPGNKGWTAQPTTEVIFRLFRGISTLRMGGPQATSLVLGLNTEQVRVLNLLGIDVLDHPRVQVATPREPQPGERAFKPRPRRTKKSNRVAE